MAGGGAYNTPFPGGACKTPLPARITRRSGQASGVGSGSSRSISDWASSAWVLVG